MIKDIKSIFSSITPDNIKELPVIKDAMDIFIETLEELSKESIDIRNIYQNEKIKDQLVQIYLDDLYNVLKAVQSNEQVISAVDRINELYGQSGKEVLRKDAIINISEYINEEHFLSFKSYKQNKGTKEAIEYIYTLIYGFVGTEEDRTDIRFIEGKNPFEFEVEGGLPAEIYEYIIYPLAHPIGFTFTYTRFISLLLEDYFPELSIDYNTNVLETRCLFPDGTTKVKKFIDKNLTRQEQIDAGLDLDLKVLEIKNLIEGPNRVRLIFLSNGQYLRQETTNLGQTSVKLLEGEGSDTIIVNSFAGQCSVYIEYDAVFNTTVKDEKTWSIEVSEGSDYVSRLDLRNIGSSISTSEDLISTIQYDVNTGKYLGSIIISEEPPEGQEDIGFFIGDPDNVGDTFELTELFAGAFYNPYLTVDGDYNIGGDFSNGRIEIFYAPTFSADVKHLLGKYKENVQIFDNDGNLIYTQPIKYTEQVFQTPSVDEELSEKAYKKLNLGNERSLGREYSYESISFDAFGGDRSTILLEPVYSGSADFIDYNGDSRGYVASYLQIIEDAEEKKVGEQYSIGGFYSDDPDNGEELSITVFETVVNGDAVNFQTSLSEILDVGYSTIFNEEYSFTQDGTFSFGVEISDVLDDNYEGITENNISVVIFRVDTPTTYTEFDTSSRWWQYVDDGTTVGDGSFVNYKEETKTADGEAYFASNDFEPEQDDVLEFGVYRDGVLLEDNNVSSI